jgi:hypothetical protein
MEFTEANESALPADVTLSVAGSYALIYPICLLSIAYAFYNFVILRKIQMDTTSDRAQLLNSADDA